MERRKHLVRTKKVFFLSKPPSLWTYKLVRWAGPITQLMKKFEKLREKYSPIFERSLNSMIWHKDKAIADRASFIKKLFVEQNSLQKTLRAKKCQSDAK